jgi:hypothetical protein
MTSQPTRTTSLLSPLTLRTDIARDVALDYWANQHAAKVIKLPNLQEYNQRLLSATDHGYWPATPTVGTKIPGDFVVDGFAEIRFSSAPSMLVTGLHSREVMLDEQNVFARVLGQATGPGGGRWWTDGFDDTVGHHTALLVRRRQGVRGSAFRRFVHDTLGPALHAAGVKDLRTYTFLPYTTLVNASPGVAHDYPAQHRYHGVVLFGTHDRAGVDELFEHATIAAVVEQQHTAVSAVHAYTVERTVPVIRTGTRS